MCPNIYPVLCLTFDLPWTQWLSYCVLYHWREKAATRNISVLKTNEVHAHNFIALNIHVEFPFLFDFK